MAEFENLGDLIRSDRDPEKIAIIDAGDESGVHDTFYWTTRRHQPTIDAVNLPLPSGTVTFNDDEQP